MKATPPAHPEAGEISEHEIAEASKDPEKILREWEGERIHRAADVELYGLDPRLVDEVAAKLERRMVFSLSVTGERLYITLGDAGS